MLSRLEKSAIEQMLTQKALAKVLDLLALLVVEGMSVAAEAALRAVALRDGMLVNVLYIYIF